MQFLVALITRVPLPVLLAACLTAQTAAPPPSYRFSANGAAPGIPVEVVANGLVLMHAKVNDHPGWFIVDNAVQGFVADRDYTHRISLQESGKALTLGEAPNPSEAGIVRDVRITLPGLELTHRVLVVIDLKSLEPAIGHRIDGIIGSRLFDDFVVLMDYQRGSMSVYAPERYQPSGNEKPLPVRVDQHGFQFIEVTIVLRGVAPVTGEYLIDSGANSYLEIYKPYRSYGDPSPYDQSGLRIHADGPSFHKFVVGRVLPGSPAAEAGIEPDDIIESLDRKSANEMTLTQLRSLLTQSNARYSVGIIRGKSRLRINLPVRP